jgi:hypothetical protein
MTKDKQTTDVRFRLSPNDVARLNEQCKRFELTRSELLRYYIRQGYDSMGECLKTDIATQQQLFPVTMPGGAHTTSPPLPKQPPKETP